MKIRILVVAAALVGVAGCGGGDGTTIGSAQPPSGSTAPSTPATPSTPAPTSAPPATVAPTEDAPTASGPGATEAGPSSSRCHTSELAASLQESDAAAGNRYATLRLTNRSQRTCTVFGYGGLQPLDAAKKQLPITLTRDTGKPPTLVRLAPGASVGRTIHWGVVPSGSEPCPTPAYASIIPPDETDPLVIGWSLGPVCGGRMDGWPYGVIL